MPNINLFQKWSYVKDLRTVLNMLDFQMDFVISGPPGCGKTTFVRDICTKKGYKFYFVSKNQIFGSKSVIFSPDLVRHF